MNTKTILYGSLAVLGIGILVAAGCGDDGSETPTGPTATITTETVRASVNSVGTIVDNCTSLLGPSSAVAPVESAAAAADIFTAASTVDGPGTYAGNCASGGGTLTVSEVSHVSGVTTFTFDFQSFCSQSSSGEKTVLNGAGTVIEHGTPSDAGPIVSNVTGATGLAGVHMARTESDGVTSQSDRTIKVTGFNRVFGTPYNAFTGPVPPTQAHPDTVAISSVSATNNESGDEVSLSGLGSKLFIDSGSNYVLEVSDGRVSATGHGTMDVITVAGDPIVVNAGHQVIDGAIKLTGAGGHSVVIAIDSGTATLQDLTVSIDGVQLGSGAVMDCSKIEIDDLFYPSLSGS